jgi:hypothetical protein
MKNTLLGLLLGMFLILGTAASTVSIMTVKPQTPKSTIVKSFRSYYGLEQDIEKYVKQMVGEGYIVKSIAMSEDKYVSRGAVVLEKY